MTTLVPDDAADLTAHPVESAPAFNALQSRYHALSAGMTVGLVVQDASGVFVDANAAATRMLGVTVAQLQGRRSSDPRWRATDEDGQDLPAHRYPIAVARVERRPVHGVTIGLKRSDGTRAWLDVSADVVVEHGEVVLAYATFTDITARHELTLEVRQQEQQLRAIVDHSPLGIATVERCNGGWTVTTANQAFQHLVRRTADRTLGADLLALLPAEQRDGASADLSRVMLGRRRSDVVEWEVSGGVHGRAWVRVVLSPIHGTDPTPSLLLQVEDVTEQRADRERARRLARHDALTGLANRVPVTEAVSAARVEALRSGQRFAVMFLDLDQFKLVNDTLGHDVGDRLLCVLAERLTSVVGPDDATARLGGDEFMVLQRGLGPDRVEAIAHAGELADRIIASLSRPVDLDGETVQVGVSVGFALGTGEEDQRELLRRADLAMYRAKDDGRGRYRVYEPEMRVAAERRVEIERDLHRAIQGGELRVHLQPVVETSTGRLIAAEALLRWEHPVRGLLAPGDFLEVAEESGLIVPIDSWVIGEACRVLAAVRARGVDLPSVAVNVSGRQLRQRDVPTLVHEAVTAHGIHPSSLAIELTERTLIDRSEPVMRQLRTLQAMGVQIGLDDFGTGQSSLSNAKDLPVAFLKIDRSFVGDVLEDRPSRAVVAGIARLADELRLPAVAEGVEDLATLRAVEEFGCVAAQGWLFGRPVPPEKFEAPAPVDRRPRDVSRGRGRGSWRR